MRLGFFVITFVPFPVVVAALATSALLSELDYLVTPHDYDGTNGTLFLSLRQEMEIWAEMLEYHSP